MMIFQQSKIFDIKVNTESDGNLAVETSSESGFGINADNVSEATFESENGTFNYFDIPLQNKLIDEGKYYVEIPLTDEENKLYHDKYENKDREFYNYLSKYKDLSNILTENRKMLKITQFIIQTRMITKMKISFFWIEKKYYFKLLKSDCKKFTAKTYRNGDKIQDVIYYANGASNALLKNPDLKYEDLPSDTITITVKFKDGQKVTKKIKTSFNSKRSASASICKINNKPPCKRRLIY